MFFLLSSTFQTHFAQLTKPSQVFVRPTGIQALPSPVNSTIIKHSNVIIELRNVSRITILISLPGFLEVAQHDHQLVLRRIG